MFVMVQRRSVGVCILLTLVTCGIYGIYWYICMVNDVNALTGKAEPSGGVVFLLSLVTCGIYGLVWLYQAGVAMDQLRTRSGRDGGNQGILYLVLAILQLSIVSYALLQSEINDYAA